MIIRRKNIKMDTTKFFFLSMLKFSLAIESNLLYFDSFNGNTISIEEYNERVVKNTTFWCTNVLEACNPDDWRRIDGSCNNLKNPSRGMPHTPNLRLLPATYSGNCQEGFEPRKAQSGELLPSERMLRTSLLPEGRIPDPVFTQMISHFLLFMVHDVVSVHDTFNYLVWKPDCCSPQGKQDKDCIPLTIPKDDPVHRFGNLHCMKLTRPLSYQSEGCLPKNSKPEIIASSTPTFDLSHLYGTNLETLAAKGRLFKSGLLKIELEDGIIWPPSSKSDNNGCLVNHKPTETRCHDTPEPAMNLAAGMNFNSIWFWRLHNYIANALSKVNPCWDDDKLFYTARDINIAFYLQIIYYELWPSLMGLSNLISAGVVSPTLGFRELYNEQILPQVSQEYSWGLSWFHTVQENDQKMYDAKGNYLKSVPLTNVTLRTGYLAIDKNFPGITQGSFRQAGGRFDNIVDPDMSEIGLGPLTDTTDLAAFNLVKNRYYGLAPYVKYLEICHGVKVDTFEKLHAFMEPEMITIMRDKYGHVEDIDLMAGLWVESRAEGSFLPKTLQCVVMDQLIRSVQSDRHWYERPNRPHAFSLDQLLEIRKASISRLLCNVGDTVTEIQPRAFLIPGPGNEIISCDYIPDMDFQAWKDNSCCDDNSTTQ